MTRRRLALSALSGDERGQAVVEFAPILLLLLTVVFGIFEVGRLSLIYIALADGARAGVRYAVVHGSNSSSPSKYNSYSSVQTQVTNITALAGITIPAPTVSYPSNTGGTGSDPNGNLSGDPVKVVATYTFQPIVTGIATINSLSGVVLSSSSQGNILY
jgi:Flp pilus assembly protein TadG